MIGVWSSVSFAMASAQAAKPAFEYFYQVPYAKGSWMPSADCGGCSGGSPCCIDPSLPNATGSCLATTDCTSIHHGYGTWYTITQFPDVFFADGLQSAVDFSFHPIIRNEITLLDRYQVCALYHSSSSTQSFQFVECLLMKQPYARHCENATESECESAARADVWSCTQISELDMWWYNIESCFNGSLGDQLSSKAFARSTELLQQVSDSSTESVWVLDGQATCTSYTENSVSDYVILSEICKKTGIAVTGCHTTTTTTSTGGKRPLLQYFYQLGGHDTNVYTDEVIEFVWRTPGMRDAVDFSFNPVVTSNSTTMDIFQVCAFRVASVKDVSMFEVVNCLVLRDPEQDCQRFTEDECDQMLKTSMFECSQYSDLDMWFFMVDVCMQNPTQYPDLLDQARAKAALFVNSSASDAAVALNGNKLGGSFPLPWKDTLIDALCAEGIDVAVCHKQRMVV